jgi:hypothetical protein
MTRASQHRAQFYSHMRLRNNFSSYKIYFLDEFLGIKIFASTTRDYEKMVKEVNGLEAGV